MTTFNATKYNKSFIWVNNDYLVNPETAAKRCACCNKLYYSIEYADHPDFDDGKINVCNRCVRQRKAQEKVWAVVEKTGITKQCKKCEKEVNLASFLGRKGDWYDIKTYCEDCRSMPKDVIPT